MSTDIILGLIRNGAKFELAGKIPPIPKCTCRGEFEQDLKTVMAAGLSSWELICSKCGQVYYWEWKNGCHRRLMESPLKLKDGEWAPAESPSKKGPMRSQTTVFGPATLSEFRKLLEEEEDQTARRSLGRIIAAFEEAERAKKAKKEADSQASPKNPNPAAKPRKDKMQQTSDEQQEEDQAFGAQLDDGEGRLTTLVMLAL